MPESQKLLDISLMTMRLFSSELFITNNFSGRVIALTHHYAQEEKKKAEEEKEQRKEGEEERKVSTFLS